jgi:hypothetical protein
MNLKAKRARSWQRGVERSAARKTAQANANRINQQIGTSPWETEKAFRAERRAQDPEVQNRRRQHEAGLR